MIRIILFRLLNNREFEVVRKADNIILKLKKVTLFEISNTRLIKIIFRRLKKKKSNFVPDF